MFVSNKSTIVVDEIMLGAFFLWDEKYLNSIINKSDPSIPVYQKDGTSNQSVFDDKDSSTVEQSITDIKDPSAIDHSTTNNNDSFTIDHFTTNNKDLSAMEYSKTDCMDSSETLPMILDTSSTSALEVNPEAKYAAIGKAKVEFFSNCLDDALNNWDSCEKEENRRALECVVVSYRPKSDSPDRNVLINCNIYGMYNMKMIPPGYFLISCLYWKSKDKYYITLLNLFHILEGSLSVKIKQQEKKRIIKNLEIYNPITLCRDGNNNTDDGDKFFKLIMSHKCPAQRSAKEIKLYEWNLLEEIVKDVTTNFVPSVSTVALSQD